MIVLSNMLLQNVPKSITDQMCLRYQPPSLVFPGEVLTRIGKLILPSPWFQLLDYLDLFEDTAYDTTCSGLVLSHLLFH